MWTTKRVATPCPTCGGVCHLTLTMATESEPAPSGRAVGGFTVAVEVRPKLFCTGMTDPPLGDPMWDACGWFILGRVEGGDAVFDRV